MEPTIYAYPATFFAYVQCTATIGNLGGDGVVDSHLHGD